jgi:hypothetical protein
VTHHRPWLERGPNLPSGSASPLGARRYFEYNACSRADLNLNGLGCTEVLLRQFRLLDCSQTSCAHRRAYS